MKKILLSFGALMLAVLASAGVASAASAQSVGVQPLKTELALDPGTSETFTLKIINRSEKDQKVVGSIESFSANDENGYPVSGEEMAADDPQNVLNWVVMDKTPFTVPASNSVDVTLTVNVPADAQPGGRYAAMFYEPYIPDDEYTGAVKIRTRVASLLLVRVNGEVTETGEVTRYELDQQNLVTDQPVKFAVQFKNTGTIHVKPVGQITLIDKDGNQLKQVGKIMVDKTEQVVDYIPVNDAAGNVLPGSSRTFLGEWINPKFSEGLTANLALTYGTGDRATTVNQSIPIQVNADIELGQFSFDKETKQFSFDLTNKGNFRVRPQLNIEIMNDFDFQVDAVPYDDEMYIEPGETRTIIATWDKNPPNGKYIGRVVFTSPVLADIKLETTFRIGDDLLASIMDSQATPFVAGFLVIAIVAIYLYKRSNKKAAAATPTAGAQPAAFSEHHPVEPTQTDNTQK